MPIVEADAVVVNSDVPKSAALFFLFPRGFEANKLLYTNQRLLFFDSQKQR